MASQTVHWKNIKYWLWVEVTFPLVEENFEDNPFAEPKKKFPVKFGAGPQDIDCGGSLDGDIVCFEILSFQSEFELNSIPTAIVNIALGRRADDVDVVSAIHYYVDDFKIQLPATVWCQAKVGETSTGPCPLCMPTEPFVVFEGYVTGTGFRRSTSNTELSLSLTHWLTDLNFSSCTAKQSHPLNPAQIYNPINHVMTEELSGGSFLDGVQPTVIGQELAIQFFNALTLTSDFWGGEQIVGPDGYLPSGLKDYFLALTRMQRINANQIVNLSGADTSFDAVLPELNWEACRALQRFEPNAKVPAHGIDEEGYVLGVKLAMEDNPTLSSHIADAIATAVGTESLDVASTMTLWDKLAGQFHAEYRYAVVPTVLKALVVPFTPGLRGEMVDGEETLVHRVLLAAHYESIEFSSIVPRPLRGVGIFMGRKFNAGASFDKKAGISYRSFGGWFDKMTKINPGDPEPDPRYKEGLILFKEAPNWLNNLAPGWPYAADSTGKNNTVKTTTSPDAGAPTTEDSQKEILENAADTIWNQYARSLYVDEILKNRQGVITGPVRFDIAPGSTLKVEVAEDKFVQNVLFPGIPSEELCDSQYTKFYYCAVLRVSTAIDCQNARAYTTFYVAHIRDYNENQDNSTSIEEHPLWSKCQWAGCVLVQDNNFSFWPWATVGGDDCFF